MNKIKLDLRKIYRNFDAIFNKRTLTSIEPFTRKIQAENSKKKVEQKKKKGN